MNDEVELLTLTYGMMYWDIDQHHTTMWDKKEGGFLVIWSYVDALTKGMEWLFS